MVTLAERFEAKVDRSGDHHRWTGAVNGYGVGQMRVNGRLTTARRVAWELGHGELPRGTTVIGCPGDRACVRFDHLELRATSLTTPVAPVLASRGGGSKAELSPGVWKLTVTAGRHEDGTVRRAYKTIRTRSARQASRELAAFVAEVSGGRYTFVEKEARNTSFDEAVDRYLTEYLQDEKGREAKTIRNYRILHAKWFSPGLGARPLRNIDLAAIDRIFGQMRRAGLSRGRMNEARSLYAPLFRWAKRRRMISHNPMLEFELPSSSYVSHDRVPPEAEELSRFLTAALEVVPEVAPVLTVGAVTGMRRGELVALRRSRIEGDDLRITVDVAVDASTSRIKGTKTRRERSFYIDAETMAMLRRHCERMDERAVAVGDRLAEDPFVFSLEPDCSKPMSPDYLTKRVAVLKDTLGIADKRPATIALEDEALRLYRQVPRASPARRSGPVPKGARTFAEIGRELGRSEGWAALAVRSAERREAAEQAGVRSRFDGSILALRKFTSSELLDAGFNISVVAQRQGHGPQVLVKHYSKRRATADRNAADHLGRVVHARNKTG